MPKHVPLADREDPKQKVRINLLMSMGFRDELFAMCADRERSLSDLARDLFHAELKRYRAEKAAEVRFK